MRGWKNVLVTGVVALAISLSASAARPGIPLGIFIQDTTKGVFVTDVNKGGIADRCMPRLRQGAHIVTVNGSPITSAEQFRRVIESSNFVKFEFIDASGELRWARAWSSGGGYYGGIAPGSYNSLSAYNNGPMPDGGALPKPAAPADTAGNIGQGVAPTEVLFLVRVPENATVWANGVKTAQTGFEREFVSNSLTPGQHYTYTIRAQGTHNGAPFDLTRQIKVLGGERRVVDFFPSPQ